MHFHRRRRYTIISIHDRSWGRTLFALAIAEVLQKAGGTVSFIVNQTNETVLVNKGYEMRVVGNSLGSLIAFAVEEFVAELEPDVLLLSDYFSTCNMLHRFGFDAPDFLFERPVISLDIWDYERTGSEIDVFSDRSRPLCLIDSNGCMRNFLDRTHRIVPVPIAPLHGRAPRFRMLQRSILLKGRQAGQEEKKMKTILTTTADWQQCNLHEYYQRLAMEVPRLIASYLECLGPNIRWLHVGPKAFDLEGRLEGRYEWLGRVSSRKLDEIVDQCDLVMSMNASASTSIRAFIAQRPVILVKNSLIIDENQLPQDIDCLSAPADWVERMRPVYPFRIMPLGYFDFLTPLTEENSYFEAMTVLEVLDKDKFIQECERLLFGSQAKYASAAAQGAYIEQLASLPDAAEVIERVLQSELGEM